AIRGAMDAHVLCLSNLVPAYDAWRSIPVRDLNTLTIIQYVGMYMTVKAGAEGLSSAAENWRAPQVPQYSLQSPVDYINTVISLASAGATAYQSYKGKEGMKSEIKQIVGEEIKQVYDKIDEVEKDLRDEGNKRFDELKKDKRGLEENIRDEMVRNNYYRLVTSILDIMEKTLPERYRGRIFKFQALLNTHPARNLQYNGQRQGGGCEGYDEAASRDREEETVG
ncbi:17632_t:CDS:2, partial [Funneliformis geosporum]